MPVDYHGRLSLLGAYPRGSKIKDTELNRGGPLPCQSTNTKRSDVSASLLPLLPAGGERGHLAAQFSGRCRRDGGNGRGVSLDVGADGGREGHSGGAAAQAAGRQAGTELRHAYAPNATSWRSWGGIQTQQDAEAEAARIRGELEKLPRPPTFPSRSCPWPWDATTRSLPRPGRRSPRPTSSCSTRPEVGHSIRSARPPKT